MSKLTRWATCMGALAMVGCGPAPTGSAGISIGMLTSKTGSLASSGQENLQAVTMAVEEINAKIDTLNTESQKMGAAVYAAAAQEGESGEAPGTDSGDAASGEASGAEDDVVDAEVVEDDEETK